MVYNILYQKLVYKLVYNILLSYMIIPIYLPNVPFGCLERPCLSHGLDMFGLCRKLWDDHDD